tara:strand:+ start:3610 stop:4143 length:534 start_codon:yes stop_codon:yes gene_type:complete
MKNITIKQLINTFLVVLLTVSSAGFLYFTFYDTPSQALEQTVDFDSNELLIESIHGEPINFNSFSSKVIVVNFWATWCGPCLIEIPALISLQQTYASDDLQIVGISVDDSADSVKAFSKKMSFNYPIAMSSYRIKKKFGGIYSIPTTFILDNTLTIKHKLQGYHSKNTLESIIISLL